jgi:hypothetical protein
MSNPDPLGGAVWRRGALLGLQWLAVFFAVTVLLWAALGVLGGSGVVRALCAMFLGPVIGTLLIAAWWRARRPALVGSERVDNEEGGDAS